MLSTFIIVFRETLEAALIVTVVLAASRGIANRGWAVTAGIALGLAGAGIVALFAENLAGLFGGNGTELFNAAVLLLAVCMLAWHQIWMSSHGAELAAASRAVGHAVRDGARPLSALAVICAMAVMREGAETVLFLYGVAAEGSADMVQMLAGGAFGALAAAALGWLLYNGLVRIPLKNIFRITGVIIVLLAAGLAAQAAALLVQAGYLPALGYDIWNSSAVLAQDSALGTLLHILIGYVARPEGIQIVAYILTVVLIIVGTGMVRRASASQRTA